MNELFFYSNGIVHMKFIPENAAVNQTQYKEIIGRLSDSILRKRPGLWLTMNWLLLHDNDPALCSVLVLEKLSREQVTVFPHPPYSPDHEPCDFFSFLA